MGNFLEIPSFFECEIDCSSGVASKSFTGVDAEVRVKEKIVFVRKKKCDVCVDVKISTHVWGGLTCLRNP